MQEDPKTPPSGHSDNQLPPGSIPFAGGYFQPVLIDRPVQSDSDVITLRRLIDAVWRQRRVFVAASIGSIAVAFAVLFLSTPKYEATITVAPASTAETSQSGLSSLMSKGGFSALGLGVTEEATSPFLLFLEMAFSHDVATRLAEDKQLTIEMFASEWNADEDTWQQPFGLGSFIKRPFYFAAGIDLWQPPSGERVQSYLQKNVKISQIGKSSIYRLNVVHKDPGFALKLIESIHKTSDEFVRSEDLEASKTYIQYLNKRLASENSMDQRRTLINLLAEKQEILMLASVDYFYAAKIIEAPWVTAAAVEPNIKIVLLMFVGFGVLFGLGMCFLLDFSKED